MDSPATARATGLLDLPTEVFEVIVRDAIIARGIRRGLRLRLVNKTFAHAVIPVAFFYHLFDQVRSLPCTRNSHSSRRPACPQLASEYLAYRVKNEAEDGNPVLLHIAKIANEIVAQKAPGGDEQPNSVDACIDQLCSQIALFSLSTERSACDGFYERLFFAAAICTNTLPIIRNLVQGDYISFESRYLTAYTGIFDMWEEPSCKEIAGKHASEEVLEYLLSLGDPADFYRLRRDIFWEAVRVGRASIVEFLYQLREAEFPWAFEDLSRQYGMAVLVDGPITPSWEVFQFLEQTLALRMPPTYGPSRFALPGFRTLVSAARAGRMDTVRYLVEYGVSAAGNDPLGLVHHQWSNAVGEAIMRGDSDMTEYLLEHGASRDAATIVAARCGRTQLLRGLLEGRKPPVGALAYAVEGGYLPAARLLLDAGADVHERVREPSLVYAIRNEHTEMFELLVARGADVTDPETLRECIDAAWKDGLDSMLDLLVTHGVDVTEASRPQFVKGVKTADNTENMRQLTIEAGNLLFVQ